MVTHDHAHNNEPMETEAISPELDELTCNAIGYALDKLAMGEGIWPTLFLQDKHGHGEYFVFEDDGLDVCLIQARESVKQLGKSAVRYALYYDGFFKNDADLATNALVVEFAERDMPTAYSAIVAYGNPGDEATFWYDEPVAGGEEDNLFE